MRPKKLTSACNQLACLVKSSSTLSALTHLHSNLLLRKALKNATKTETSIVADYIDFLELVESSFECFFDTVLVSHIECDCEIVVVGRVLELGQSLGLARSCDYLVAVLEGDVNVVLA